jgi:hypothetical protein
MDKNCWRNQYLFVDYIKIYYSPDFETDGSIVNNTEIAKNVSQDNDSAIIKYGIIGFLVLSFYFIKKRTSKTKSIKKNNDSEPSKCDNFRKFSISTNVIIKLFTHNYAIYRRGRGRERQTDRQTNRTNKIKTTFICKYFKDYTNELFL